MAVNVPGMSIEYPHTLHLLNVWLGKDHPITEAYYFEVWRHESTFFCFTPQNMAIISLQAYAFL